MLCSIALLLLNGSNCLLLRRRCRRNLRLSLGRRRRLTCLPSPSALTRTPLVKLLPTTLPSSLKCRMMGILPTEPEASPPSLLLARLHITLVPMSPDRTASAPVPLLTTTLRDVRYLRYPLPAKQIGEATSLPQGPVGLASSAWSTEGTTTFLKLPSILRRRGSQSRRRFPQQNLQLLSRNLLGPTSLL